MMNNIISIISLPVAAGLLLFIAPERFRTVKGLFALLVSVCCCFLAVNVFTEGARTNQAAISHELIMGRFGYLTFNSDSLSRLILILVNLFTFLILLYSLSFTRNIKIRHYYSWLLITFGCSCGAVLSDNLLLFLGFWGVLGITLYKLIQGQDEESSAAAKKTLVLIGASDSIMIIGIAIVWSITGALNISSISIPTSNTLSSVAFLALLTGSFTKAGAFPLHSWVPDYAKNAPASSSAYLPASLDKLLGIYFLARLTTQMFVLNQWLTLVLLLLAVTSIMAAVMMALVQHSYKRLLGFHAVSQVGYMILGFALGSTIGIAAGLFHMINNALYKSGLFLTAGSVEYRTGKDDIDDLGGLSGAMPLTFVSALIFAVSISGIPPFNGFASKWMIYQAIIDFGSGTGAANHLWFVWLGLAVLGSALTLASFIKLIGGVYLGRQKADFSDIKETPITMWVPLIFLALACTLSGVFATNFIVPYLLIPVTGNFRFTGFWDSSMVSMLVLISLALGVIAYLILRASKFRTEDSFIGGEKIQEQAVYPATEFYNTIKEFRLFSWFYGKAEEKWFDVYDLSKKSVLWLSHQFSEAHTGVLTGYVLWALAGLIVMLLIML